MSTDEPFFDPLPPPPSEEETSQQVHNVPWSPPLNVVPVTVMADLDIVNRPDVVIRLDRARVHDRGVELQLDVWLHPDALPRIDGPYGMRSEPRFGILLADGTKLGSRVDSEPGDVDESRPLLQCSLGGGMDVRAHQSWWLRPVPHGAATAVLRWDDLDIPETRVDLDTDAWRAVAAQARELWPLPDFDPEVGMGWFTYAPTTQAVYNPGRDLATGRAGEDSPPAPVAPDDGQP